MVDNIAPVKCPHCFSDVDPRATVCPHCQRKIARPNPVGRGILIVAVSALVLIFLIIPLMNGGGSPSGSDSRSAGSEEVCIGNPFFYQASAGLDSFQSAYADDDVAGMQAAINQVRLISSPGCALGVKRYMLEAMEAGKDGDHDAFLAGMASMDQELEDIERLYK